MIPTHLTALGHPVPLVERYGYKLTQPFHVEVTPHPKRASHDRPDPQTAKRWLAQIHAPTAMRVEDEIDADPQRALDVVVGRARRERRGIEAFADG
jgi:hypothetical protein